MTELEKLQRAKDYMDQLANGTDPITGQEMPEDTVLNQVRLSRCFFYVSEVLRQVLENGGTTPKTVPPQSQLPPFQLPPEERHRIPVIADRRMISHFTGDINALVDLTAMRKLKPTAMTAWLLEKGFLAEEIINDKKHKVPTEAGRKLGIASERVEGKWGPYTAVCYDDAAQRFLVDHLDEIIALSNGAEKS